MKTFYMIYRDGQGQSAPTKKHYSLFEAQGECERLAQTYPGTKFFLLRALAVSETMPPEVQTKALTAEGSEE